jgi:TrmH family RNA methyltransferase
MCGILNVQKPYCNQMPKAEMITSAANPLLKDVRRAISRGGLTAQGLCIAEGFHLAEEALRSRRPVHAILASEPAARDAETYARRAAASKFTVLSDSLFRSIASTETSQGIIALVEPPVWTMNDLFARRPLVVVLDAIQDPGNAGTIVRSAEAFGASGAIFVKGSAGPFNPKTLRASAGSMFRLPFVQSVEGAAALDALAPQGVDAYAAIPPHPGAATQTAAAADLTRPCAIVIGSEAHGVSREFQEACTSISIPTAGVESLNAAIAAAVLLYEAHRQRTAVR